MSAINDDLHVNGTLTAKAMRPPDNSITDEAVIAGAGIQYTKLEHLHRGVYRQPNSAAAAETKVVAVVGGVTGSVVAFKAGCVGPCVGADTITVDLKKNGITILAAPISLTSAQAAYATVSASVATPDLVAGGVLTVVVTPNHSSGTLGTGVFADVDYREDAQ